MTNVWALVAWAVEINDITAIVFAPTATKARYKAVRDYWDAFGRRKGEWPRAVAWREPRFDNSSLKQLDPMRCYCREFVEGT